MLIGERKMTVEEVNLEIGTPKGLFTSVFLKTAKIKEVIVAAVKALGLDAADSLELVYNGESLQPQERTLVSFGISGSAMLELVATGSGV